MATVGADMSQPGPADTAGEFSARLAGLQEVADAASPSGAGTIPMRQVFDLAKQFIGLPLPDIERLLDVPDHLARVGAVSIMDFQARRRSTDQQQRRGLYELYLRRHDRIDTWDLVDRAAPHVVGGYLWDKPRDPLYELAASPLWWERRTAIVATWFFIRQDDLDDTFGGRHPGRRPEPISSRRRSAAGSAKPASVTRSRLGRLTSTGTPPPCRAPPSATPSIHLSPELRSHYLGMKGTPSQSARVPDLMAELWLASAISESAFIEWRFCSVMDENPTHAA